MGKLLKLLISNFKFLIILIAIVVFASIAFYFLTFFSHQSQIQPAQAQVVPLISSYSGTAAHGQNITITGSNFGIKNPAAPLIWDNSESGNLLDTWTNRWPREATGNYNTDYRTAPFRNVNPPHSHSNNRFIAGGHDPAGYSPWANWKGPNVAVWKDNLNNLQEVYITFYNRIDPLWPDQNDNFKNMDYGTGPGPYESGSWYSSLCEHMYTGGQIFWGALGTQCLDTCSCCGVWLQYAWYFNYDDFKVWHREEHIFKEGASGFLKIYNDNVLKYNKTNCDPTSTSLNNITIGGYWRKSLSADSSQDYGDANAFRYWDDIYLDSTFSRVVLANNANYSQATIIEPQIPSVWSASSITAKVNLGRLPDTGTVYLFVFDASNNHNATGYPIVLGGSPPPPPTYLLPDLTKDRAINQSDFDLFKPLWGTSQADFNSDSRTDSKDFGIMMSEWGSY